MQDRSAVNGVSPTVARRSVLVAMLTGGAGMLLSACGGASATVTASSGTVAANSSSLAASSIAATSALASSAKTSISSTASTSTASAAAVASTAKATPVPPTVTPRPGTKAITFLERAGQNYQNFFKQAIDNFQQQQPGYSVLAEYSTSYHDKLIAEVAGGTAPDVVFTSDDDLFSLAAKGVVIDIGPYFTRDKLNKSDWFDIALTPQFLRGKQYAMPLDLGVWALWVNKDLFKKAGVALPDDTWDFNKFQDAAQRLTVDSKGSHAPGLDPNSVVQAGFNDSAFTYGIDIPVGAYGGSVFDAQVTKCLLQEQPAVDGLQWTADLTNKAHAALGAGIKTQGTVNFNSGNLAMQISGSWAIGAACGTGTCSFDWDIYAPPKGPAKDIILAEASGISQASGSKNPDGGWLFNKYMTGPEGQMLAFEHTVASVPSIKAVADKVYANWNKQPASMKILSDLASRSSIPYWQRAVSDTDLETLFSKSLAPLFQGKQDAQAVLASAVSQVNALLQQDQQYLAGK
ncbi:MAG TPA: sugar ABC transporter substrate-binding protein [Chloroflexota bacterium]|nr:sugar ABC transporter substrate-binding protein [Chloroflexota bacterium]